MRLKPRLNLLISHPFLCATAPALLVSARRSTHSTARSAPARGTMSHHGFAIGPQQVPVSLPDGLSQEQVLSFRPFNVRIASLSFVWTNR